MYHSHLQMIRRLLLALKTADNKTSGSGALSTEEFTAVLTQFFSVKQSEAVDRLVQAAVTELSATSDALISFENLFSEVRFVIVSPSFSWNYHMKHSRQ